MKHTQSAFRYGLRAGTPFSIVLLFLVLIGFNSAGAAILARIFGHAPLSGQLPSIGYGMAFLVLLAIWQGISVSLGAKRQSLANAWSGGLAAVGVAGIVMAVFILVFGTLYKNGADFRQTLYALSPAYVKFIELEMAPALGALLTFAMMIVSGGLAGLAATTIRFGRIWQAVTGWWGQFWNSDPNRTLRASRYFKFGLYALLVFICFFLPRVWGSYWNYVFGLVGIYVLLGLGLNISVGLSGQLVLGYVAFFAIGAYTVALLNAPIPHNLMWGFWVAVVIGILLAALAGFLVGLPIMQLRGDYLAIVTLGFGEIIRVLLKSDLLTNFTGGPRGIQDIKGPTLFGVSFSSDIDFMYLIILAVGLALFVASRLQYSRVGRSWIAIREDETVARASGVNTVRAKLLALALGAAFAGIGGVMFAARNQFTGPEDHVMMVSINVLSLVIVGGMGSIPGVVLGAFALKGLPEILRELANYRLLAFGALLVFMMIARPQGLWPARHRKMTQDQDTPSEDTNTNEEVPNGELS
jgi:branched-chain amino acid transport system permease protein